jgi:hypothetical protein
MPKYCVVTTFNAKGYDQYAQKFLQTFIANWPVDIKLHVYTENCEIFEKSSNLVVYDLHSVSSDIVNFKNRWKDVPKANGDISKDPIRSRRKDYQKKFKWDAIRFSHKVYSIFHCAQNCQEDIVIWMDADMVCHSPISIEKINQLIPEDKDICYLGRNGKYPECGLYSLNLRSSVVRDFLKEFQRVYDDAENGIFRYDEWHDSYVFEQVRKKFNNLKLLSWGDDLPDLRPTVYNSKGEGHPLINSAWGAYLDHLKGDRKTLGKSQAIDLKVKRSEHYWST